MYVLGVTVIWLNFGPPHRSFQIIISVAMVCYAHVILFWLALISVWTVIMKLQCISDLAVAEALHDFDCVQSRTHFIPFVLILLNFSLIFIKLVPFFLFLLNWQVSRMTWTQSWTGWNVIHIRISKWHHGWPKHARAGHCSFERINRSQLLTCSSSSPDWWTQMGWYGFKK